MSVLFSSVVNVLTHNSLCVSNLFCSSLLQTFKLCHKNKVNGRLLGKYQLWLFYRTLHVSSTVNKLAAPNLTDSNKKNDDKKPTTKPKKEKQTYITLIGIDNKLSVTTQEDALKLSIRRDLKLVKVKDYDTKTERPTYQLMTTSQYLQTDSKENQKREKTKDSFLKGEKVVSLSQKINEHDLTFKINMMLKWISKRQEVKVVIIGNDSNAKEEVYKVIESKVKDQARIVQKRVKGLDLKFQLLPFKKAEDSTQNKEPI